MQHLRYGAKVERDSDETKSIAMIFPAILAAHYHLFFRTDRLAVSSLTDRLVDLGAVAAHDLSYMYFCALLLNTELILVQDIMIMTRI